MRVYVSHPIRGSFKGEGQALIEHMEKNNQSVINMMASIRAACPGVDFYVPAEHDEVITILYELGHLGEGAILKADCKIIERTCNAMICLNFDESGGMDIERDCCDKNSIPWINVWGPHYIQDIKDFVTDRLLDSWKGLE